MKKRVFLIFIITIAGFLYAEQTINADTAVEMAVKNNLSLKQASIDVRLKKRARNSTWNVFLPQLNATGAYSRLNEDPGIMSPYTQNSMTAGWDASLVLSAALFNGVKHTILDYESSNIDFDKAKKDLSRKVKKNFYNLLLLKKQIQIQERSILSAQDRYEQARVNYNAGLVPELTMLSAQVALENQKPGLNNLKIGYESVQMAFKFLLGIPFDEEIVLEGSIDDAPEISVNSDDLIAEYLNQRFDLMGMTQQMDMLKNQIAGQRLQQMPALSFSYGQSFTLNNALDNDPTDFSLWSDDQGRFTAAIVWRLDNFIPGSSGWNTIQNLKDNLETLELAKESVSEAAVMEIRNLSYQVNENLKSIEPLELNVALARKAYNLAEIAYNNGSKEFLEVKDAELEWDKAEYQVLGAKFQYISALLDLEYAINQKLWEGK